MPVWADLPIIENDDFMKFTSFSFIFILIVGSSLPRNIRLTSAEKQQVWAPVVDFTNTLGNHVTKLDQQATMHVNMNGAAGTADDSRPEEG